MREVHRGGAVLVLVLTGAVGLADPPRDNTCVAACGRITSCKLGATDACLAACRQSGAESTAAGKASLAQLTHASCDAIASVMRGKPAATQPQDHHVWGCMAVGALETCNGSSSCIAWGRQSISGFGLGKTRDVATVDATTKCETQMTMSMTIATMNGHARPATRCQVTQCWPPK